MSLIQHAFLRALHDMYNLHVQRYKAPLLGEHSTEVLLEAGMSKDEVAALIDSGVLVQGEAKTLDPKRARDAKSRDVNSG